ncbi:MAG TPA: baseplate J/gp47 family protein [Candidatus Cottocaccamicrobium excrementipullorum]|nr:baseplate J/gp47 family protein [Candidatus Cottocaccamicrobium excrementipullorum]
MIDLSGYTTKAILAAMLEQVDPGLDTRQGSIIQTALGPVAWYLEGVYMTLSQIQENSNPQTAVGESLDLITITRGIARNAARAAVRKGTFNVEIPSGSTFKTINGADSLIFVSGDEITDESSGENYVYQLTCTTPGTAGNSYTGAILPITAISGLTSANIGEIITAGTDEETDASLRSRFFASFDVAAFGGNISAYRNAILAIDGVGAVQVYPAWNGGGTVLCSILGSDLKPAIPATVEEVQGIICPSEDGGSTPSPNGYGMAPIGAAVTITTGTELVLNITCDIQFQNGIQNGPEMYQSQIEERIQDYINEVVAEWGAPIKSQTISYSVVIYISRIIYSILQISEIVNVSNVRINGSGNDLTLTETPTLQQVPVLGEVVINGE